MERLEFNNEEKYQAIEGSIHINRYLLVKKFCKGKKILDVACGEGYGSFLMTKWGASSVYGLDISQEAIDKARDNYKNENLNFICNPAEDMKMFEPNSFDIIVSLETIEHVNSAEQFLMEIKRLLKPGGIIILSCPNDYYYYPSESEKNPFHNKKYTLNEFKNLTQNILGPYDDFLLGVPVSGFANIRERISNIAPENMKQNQFNMFNLKDNYDSILLPPDEIITEKNCSYFIGIWGEVNNLITETAAIYPRGMDSYPNYEKYIIEEELSESKNEIARLKSRYDEELKKLELTIDALKNENELIRQRTELKLEAIKAENLYLKENGKAVKDINEDLNVTNMKNELLKIMNSRLGSKMIKVFFKLKLNKLFK